MIKPRSRARVQRTNDHTNTVHSDQASAQSYAKYNNHTTLRRANRDRCCCCSVCRCVVTRASALPGPKIRVRHAASPGIAIECAGTVTIACDRRARVRTECDARVFGMLRCMILCNGEARARRIRFVCNCNYIIATL